MQTDLCRYLTRDSEFFGLRIARLLAPQLTPVSSLSAGYGAVEAVVRPIQ
jgi:hypothetical protein